MGMHDQNPAFLKMAREAIAALENVPTPGALVDRDGTIQWQNNASLSLRGSRVGRRFVDYVASVDQQKAREAFDRVFAVPAPVELTLRTLNLEGEYVPIHGIWSPLQLRGGTVMAVFSLRDLTGPPISEPTPRQLDVLRLLAAGHSTREIAAELSLSATTVRNYIAHIFTTLNVHSRLQAVVVARERGLLAP
jgi:DNA-binding CsgD family transcriptional regulator